MLLEAVTGPRGIVVTEAVSVLEMVSVKTIVAVELSTGTTTEPEPEIGPTDTAEVGTVTVTTGYGTSVLLEAVTGPRGIVVIEAVSVLEMVAVMTTVSVALLTGTTTDPEPEIGPTDTGEVGASVMFDATIGPTVELGTGIDVIEAVSVLEMVAVITTVSVALLTGTTTDPEPEIGPTDTPLGTVTVTTGYGTRVAEIGPLVFEAPTGPTLMIEGREGVGMTVSVSEMGPAVLAPLKLEVVWMVVSPFCSGMPDSLTVCVLELIRVAVTVTSETVGCVIVDVVWMVVSPFCRGMPDSLTVCVLELIRVAVTVMSEVVDCVMAPAVLAPVILEVVWMVVSPFCSGMPDSVTVCVLDLVRVAVTVTSEVAGRVLVIAPTSTPLLLADGIGLALALALTLTDGRMPGALTVSGMELVRVSVTVTSEVAGRVLVRPPTTTAPLLGEDTGLALALTLTTDDNVSVSTAVSVTSEVAGRVLVRPPTATPP